MPIGFSSDDVAAVKLDCVDKGKPDDQRATFRFRFLTAGEEKRVARMRGEAARASSTEETDANLNEALAVGLVGWDGLTDDKGKPVPFAPAAMDDFSLRLKFAMVDEYPIRLLLTDAEKKA